MRRQITVVKTLLAVAVLGGGVMLAATANAHGWGNGHKHGATYRTMLRGSLEVPAVSTSTSGWFKLAFNRAGDRAPFKLDLRRANDVTMAHLHCAAAGQNGPAVVTIMGEVQGGLDIHGRAVSSAIESDNILAAGAGCPTPVTDMASLKAAINNGQIYVNVHTVANPGGEIRGWLQ